MYEMNWRSNCKSYAGNNGCMKKYPQARPELWFEIDIERGLWPV